MAITLHELRDNPGARKKARPLGRGIGSGRGKTSGRGGKGQTARSGVRLKGFQGGQMPLSRRLPKRGFTNIHASHHVVVNLSQLQEACDLGKLSSGASITEEALVRAGFFTDIKDGVRLLGKGTLTHALQLTVNGASKSAIHAVEAAGGSVAFRRKTVYTRKKG